MKRIAFGLDREGFFPVLMDGDRAVTRLRSEADCHTAMVKGIQWANLVGIPAEVIRVSTTMLESQEGNRQWTPRRWTRKKR